MFLWWSGCLSDAEVARRMEAAFLASNDAVAISLAATELRVHAHETPDEELRHVTACGCPCKRRAGDGDFFVLDLDYHEEGCIPTSGLVAGGVSGVVVLEVLGDEVRASLPGGGLGGAPLEGTLEGLVAGEQVASRGEVWVDGRGFELDLVATWGSAQFTADGDVWVDGRQVTLEGVELGLAGLAAECPTPDAGTAVVELDPPVVVDFSRPGDGVATAILGRRESAATEPCRFPTTLF